MDLQKRRPSYAKAVERQRTAAQLLLIKETDTFALFAVRRNAANN